MARLALHQRIKLAREKAGYVGTHGPRDFSRAVGVTYETVRTWEKGGPKSPDQLSARNARKVVEITGVRLAWLISGEGPMFNGDDGGTTVQEVLRLAGKLATEAERLQVAAGILADVSQAPDE